MKSEKQKLFWIILFSIAMGYLEAAVVIYLRQIYYPQGFSFPLKAISAKDTIVELLREAATLIMLAGIGMLSGKTRALRFAFFLMAFGIWDLSYYLSLKIFLGWPASFSTWDILFLIPIPWVGPVWAPLLLSMTMILFAILIIKHNKSNPGIRIPFRTLLWFILGSLIVITSFCVDPIRHLYLLMGDSASYQPSHFPISIFVLGEIIILYGMFRFYRQKS